MFWILTFLVLGQRSNIELVRFFLFHISRVSKATPNIQLRFNPSNVDIF
jgi:hypothetical protein